MGYYVHLSVIFACDQNEGVAALAQKHLVLLPPDDHEDACIEAKWFLEDLAGRTGQNNGPKGGLSLWGIVGNYTHAEEFVKALTAFWKELLQADGESGGPLCHEHILVFYEPEQSEMASAIEIILSKNDELDRSEAGDLVIRHHTNLPFCWGQM